MSTCSTRRRFQGFTVRNVLQVASSLVRRRRKRRRRRRVWLNFASKRSTTFFHKWIDCGGSARWMSPFLLPFLLDPSVVFLSLSWHSTQDFCPSFPLFNNIDIQHTDQTILRHNGVHLLSRLKKKQKKTTKLSTRIILQTSVIKSLVVVFVRFLTGNKMEIRIFVWIKVKKNV